MPLSTWQGTLALLQPAVGPGPPDPASHPSASQEPGDAAQAVNREGSAAWAASSRGWGETCGHVASMAPACQILHWALALGLGLTFEVTHAFRSQGRPNPGWGVAVGTELGLWWGEAHGVGEARVLRSVTQIQGPLKPASLTRQPSRQHTGLLPGAHPRPLTLTHR